MIEQAFWVGPDSAKEKVAYQNLQLSRRKTSCKIAGSGWEMSIHPLTLAKVNKVYKTNLKSLELGQTFCPSSNVLHHDRISCLLKKNNYKSFISRIDIALTCYTVCRMMGISVNYDEFFADTVDTSKERTEQHKKRDYPWLLELGWCNKRSIGGKGIRFMSVVKM